MTTFTFASGNTCEFKIPTVKMKRLAAIANLFFRRSDEQEARFKFGAMGVGESDLLAALTLESLPSYLSALTLDAVDWTKLLDDFTEEDFVRIFQNRSVIIGSFKVSDSVDFDTEWSEFKRNIENLVQAPASDWSPQLKPEITQADIYKVNLLAAALAASVPLVRQSQFLREDIRAVYYLESVPGYVSETLGDRPDSKAAPEVESAEFLSLWASRIGAVDQFHQSDWSKTKQALAVTLKEVSLSIP
jgi:hypothetical protein